jgi:hypothetical protein
MCSPYLIGQVDPFDPVVNGARVPDEVTFPSSTASLFRAPYGRDH